MAARLTKGELTKEISYDDLASQWNKMKPIMGGAFNSAYLTRAKDQGWIDSPTRGFYVLTDLWKEALGAE